MCLISRVSYQKGPLAGYPRYVTQCIQTYTYIEKNVWTVVACCLCAHENGFFFGVFTSLVAKLKRAHIRDDCSYIIIFLTRHNEPMKVDMHTLDPCLSLPVYVLVNNFTINLCKLQPDVCEAITWKVTSNITIVFTVIFTVGRLKHTHTFIVMPWKCASFSSFWNNLIWQHHALSVMLLSLSQLTLWCSFGSLLTLSQHCVSWVFVFNHNMTVKILAAYAKSAYVKSPVTSCVMSA